MQTFYLFRKNAVAGTTIQIGNFQSSVVETTKNTPTVAAKQKKKAVDNCHLRAKLLINYTQRYACFDSDWFCNLKLAAWSKVYFRSKDGHLLLGQTNTIEAFPGNI